MSLLILSDFSRYFVICYFTVVISSLFIFAFLVDNLASYKTVDTFLLKTSLLQVVIIVLVNESMYVPAMMFEYR